MWFIRRTFAAVHKATCATKVVECTGCGDQAIQETWEHWLSLTLLDSAFRNEFAILRQHRIREPENDNIIYVDLLFISGAKEHVMADISHKSQGSTGDGAHLKVSFLEVLNGREALPLASRNQTSVFILRVIALPPFTKGASRVPRKMPQMLPQRKGLTKKLRCTD